MSSSTRSDDLRYRSSQPVYRTRPLPTRDDPTICPWDLHPRLSSFDRTATRMIKRNSSTAWSLRRDMYFILYGIACFGLVPLTAHILVTHEYFLRWYAANVAVLQCEYYFKTSIQALSLLFMSLTAMIFAGNNSTIEICARNGTCMALFFIFFVRMSEGMLRDAALYMGLIYRGEGGELVSALQQQTFAPDRFPQDGLKWGFVIEFEIFMVIYAIAALMKFTVVRSMDRKCSNLQSWKLLLRHIEMNTSTEEHENGCS